MLIPLLSPRGRFSPLQANSTHNVFFIRALHNHLLLRYRMTIPMLAPWFWYSDSSLYFFLPSRMASSSPSSCTKGVTWPAGFGFSMVHGISSTFASFFISFHFYVLHLSSLKRRAEKEKVTSFSENERQIRYQWEMRRVESLKKHKNERGKIRQQKKLTKISGKESKTPGNSYYLWLQETM